MTEIRKEYLKNHPDLKMDELTPEEEALVKKYEEDDEEENPEK